MIQISASRTALLSQCARPFSVAPDGTPYAQKQESGEPAKFGLAWHAVVAWAIETAYGDVIRRPGKTPSLKQLAKPLDKAIDEFKLEHISEELEAHLCVSIPILFRWLNQFPIDTKLEVEKSFAWHPEKDETRAVNLPNSDHVYQLAKGEIGMTVDLTVLPPHGDFYIIDHKTGVDDFSRPDKLPQLKTIGRALRNLHPKRPLVLGAFHAARYGIAKMYAEPAEGLEDHRQDLLRAMARINDGSMRPGPLCDHCPARPGCPAGDSEMLAKAERVIQQSNLVGGALLLVENQNGGLSRNRRLGMLYEIIKQSKTLGEKGTEAIKREMEDGACPELDDGSVLVLRTRQVERLAKKDFIAAYGKLEANRLFAKWRKDGAMILKPEEYLTSDD